MAVLRPVTTEEVAAVVRLCAQRGIAIVPQGGNTNVCGMTLADKDSIILNLSRMNRILSLDTECQTVTVEAGATIQAVQEAAIAAGMLFSPDWGARGTAQVGGAVATNGGGLNVLAYGTTREQVLGMEVVLADGRIWNGLRALIKDNSGYDLKHLFIGSEGTLGIITRLVFRLHPAPARRVSMMAVLTDNARLTECFALAKSLAGGQLVAFELMNGLGVELALERYPDLQRPLAERAQWYLLIRLAGDASITERMEMLYERAIETGLLADATLAQSLAQEHNLWEIREQLMPAQYFRCPSVKWDVSVPISRMIEFLARAEAMAFEGHPDAVPYAVGHVGDGNVHYNIFLPDMTPEAAKPLISEYIDRIDSLILDLGGSITAEHGVGTIYRERVQRTKSAVEHELLKSLRDLFDPTRLFNPGKLL